jgi:dinuclear metal center YbgI/SA1388 family protein
MPMTTIESFHRFLANLAPPRLAESWDNVGLLVGDQRAEVRRLMTCLTVTPQTVEEAIREHADLIVTHHPLPFTALKRLTSDTVAGAMLLKLVAAGVAVYSPHTAFDSAAEGINQRLAAGLGLTDIAPLTPHPEGQGAGRFGKIDPGAPGLDLAELARRVMSFLGLTNIQAVGKLDQRIRTVAVACGAAGELLDIARKAFCDAMVLGEARFHMCLEAEAWGIGLVLPGHFASERFALDALAELLAQQYPDVRIWASRDERDPLKWIGRRLSAADTPT